MNAALLTQLRRAANLKKFGEQDWPDGTGPSERRINRRDAQQKETAAAQGAGTVTYLQILKEEFLEAACESDPEKLLAELIDVAAVAEDWADLILRRQENAMHEAEERGGGQ